MKSILDSKRGNFVADTVTVIIVLLVFSVVVVLVHIAMSNVNDAIQTDASFSNNTKNSISDGVTQFSQIWDSLVGLSLGLFYIAALLLSYSINSRWIFAGIAIFLFPALILISGELSNMWLQFYADADIANVASLYPIQYFIWSHFIEIIIGFGLSIAMVLYLRK